MGEGGSRIRYSMKKMVLIRDSVVKYHLDSINSGFSA